MAKDTDTQQATNAQRAATLKAAGLSANAELTEKQAERLNTLAGLHASGGLPESMVGGKLGNAIMKGTGMPRPGAKDRESDTKNVLEAAVAVMKAAKGPLTRAEITERVEKKKIKRSGKVKVASIVNTAQVDGRVVNGLRITRPERGKYTVEKAS